MQSTLRNLKVIAVAASVFVSGAVFAQAPASAQAAPAGYGVKIGKFFSDQEKAAARKVFSQKYAKAPQCPEGLTLKGKSCASPWDQRYWAVGQALQPAVKVYEVPAPVVATLPPAPKGYEYVRAADDILLIASGSKLIVDMIGNITS